jgi:hypothetical protein
MTKREAAYFVEGIAAAVAAPDPELLKSLYVLLAFRFGISPDDLATVRREIDQYIDEAEAEVSDVGQKP